LQAALLVMKYIFRDELPERLPGILGLLKDLPRQHSGLDYLHTVLRYLSRGTDKLSRTELNHAVQHTFARGEAIMSTIATRGRAERPVTGFTAGCCPRHIPNMLDFVAHKIEQYLVFSPEYLMFQCNLKR